MNSFKRAVLCRRVLAMVLTLAAAHGGPSLAQTAPGASDTLTIPIKAFLNATCTAPANEPEITASSCGTYGGIISFVTESMPPAGPITVRGVEFIWPGQTEYGLTPVPAQFDTILNSTTPVDLGGYSGYKSIALLTAGATGDQWAVNYTVTYTDGSTEKVPLWVRDMGALQSESDVPGVREQELSSDANPQAGNGSIKLLMIPIDPKKGVRSLTLPSSNVMTYAVSLTNVTLQGPTDGPKYLTKGPVEAKYHEPGPWGVEKITTTDACDSKGNVCVIFVPQPLGVNPQAATPTLFVHPLISWANGSGLTAENYEYLLRHIASWGFVVVASENGSTGDGTTTVDAANYMLAKAATPGDKFYKLIDPKRVGTAGHSQGGGSVVSLFAHQTAPFSTYVAIHPAPSYFEIAFCNWLPTDMQNATKGSILYLQSVGDGGAADTKSNYYDPTPDSATKAIGILANAKHDDEQGNPHCTDGICITGVYGYLGYPTAWLMWKLQGATDIAGAFDSTNGEFTQPSPDWSFNGSNITVGTSSGGASSSSSSGGSGSSSSGGSSGSSSSSSGGGSTSSSSSSGGGSNSSSSSSGSGSSGSSSGGTAAPSASLQATPVTGTAPLAVSFDASGSRDPNAGGSITGYAFNFGDGATQSGSSAKPSHTYTRPGSYTASVTVTDSEGGSASQSVVIRVQSAQADTPSASLSVSTTSGTIPLAVQFDASGSRDANGTITNYLFDFGDGSSKVSQTTATTSHTYSAAGTYQASVTVTNSFGNTAAAYVPIQASGSVVVAPASGPVAELSLSPSTGAAPLTVTLDGSKSYDTDSTRAITSYTFDFGDGSAAVTQSSPTVNHVYSQPGNYNPSLSVVDSGGNRSAAVAMARAQVTSATSGGSGGDGSTSGSASSGGGAFAPAALMPLLLGAALRRKRGLAARNSQ